MFTIYGPHLSHFCSYHQHANVSQISIFCCASIRFIGSERKWCERNPMFCCCSFSIFCSLSFTFNQLVTPFLPVFLLEPTGISRPCEIQFFVFCTRIRVEFLRPKVFHFSDILHFWTWSLGRKMLARSNLFVTFFPIHIPCLILLFYFSTQTLWYSVGWTINCLAVDKKGGKLCILSSYIDTIEFKFI